MIDEAVVKPTYLDRKKLADELFARYGRGSFRQQVLFLRKKYFWLLAVGGAAFLKRVLDVSGALVGLILLAPIFGVVALIIKWTDKGPVFYVAPRVGKWGREFAFPKFRSMRINASQLQEELQAQSHHEDVKTFKMKKDPRVTPIGRFIRKLSIDELPQLWCVVRGDMSLVGPRPPLPSEVSTYSLEDRRRLNITPGITGLWQVSGRGDIPFPEMVELDVQYIESRSLRMDLLLLLRTVPAVFLGKGAY